MTTDEYYHPDFEKKQLHNATANQFYKIVSQILPATVSLLSLADATLKRHTCASTNVGVHTPAPKGIAALVVYVPVLTSPPHEVRA